MVSGGNHDDPGGKQALEECLQCRVVHCPVMLHPCYDFERMWPWGHGSVDAFPRGAPQYRSRAAGTRNANMSQF
jgi:hypothetical protein